MGWPARSARPSRRFGRHRVARVQRWLRGKGSRRPPGKSRCSGLCHDRRVSPVSAAKVKEKRVRLDQLLVERGLVASRRRAQALVLAGQGKGGGGGAARHQRKPGGLIHPATT